MIKIALIRGAFLNNFEGQNYNVKELKGCKLQVTGVGSIKTIHQNLLFKVIRLPSLSDYNVIGRCGRAIANRTIGDIQNLFGLEKYASQFDIFHTADPHYHYSFQLAKLRKENKIKKLVVTSWETIPHNNETVSKKKNNKYFVIKYTDHFICHTEKAKRCLIQEGVTENKISVIRLGVDLQKFQNPNSKSQTNSKFQNSNKIQILFVGRLVKEKGIWDVYEVYKRIQNLKIKSQNITLRFVGEGSEKNKLLERIKKDNLENKVSVISKTYDEIPEEYRKADIFIAPSKKTLTWEEQYGMVFIEAMATRLPIITYDTGAIKEIVGDAGIFCKENDISCLFRSLNLLIFHKNERLKIGTIGKERVRNMFDCKKTTKKLKEMYCSVM
ncbi:hypothetical protein COY87_03040 [Candidatus Roizmanbacteria bacterium CG_4_10_14_0_8_um_filter_33_9]|uniref:Glycosyl transferase family 1 domain-containing protein n=1 Tax=Candidatus Roizmanbacteria bacterium CG_4_10_14_0_8_um_filter_33_9 TaxID=1974826 RepID=A0A2M7QJB1_9BACT|nr:MAG: hypothetical protein COY87_03040 [Candidatus Roizmanbacteria bacterium CG_4_10_14_0_8_um_filter_33_9]